MALTRPPPRALAKCASNRRERSGHRAVRRARWRRAGAPARARSAEARRRAQRAWTRDLAGCRAGVQARCASSCPRSESASRHRRARSSDALHRPRRAGPPRSASSLAGFKAERTPSACSCGRLLGRRSPTRGRVPRSFPSPRARRQVTSGMRGCVGSATAAERTSPAACALAASARHVVPVRVSEQPVRGFVIRV